MYTFLVKTVYEWGRGRPLDTYAFKELRGRYIWGDIYGERYIWREIYGEICIWREIWREIYMEKDIWRDIERYIEIEIVPSPKLD